MVGAGVAVGALAVGGCNELFGIEEGVLVERATDGGAGDGTTSDAAGLTDAGSAGDAPASDARDADTDRGAPEDYGDGGCTIDGGAFAAGQANPDNACQVCRPRASVTEWGAANEGRGCGGASGGTCIGGLCALPPSCVVGDAGAGDAGDAGNGMTSCGPGGRGSESCCTSLEVPGGTFYRTYEYPDGGGGPIGLGAQVTVSDFRLDKYEVTVGRFRQFEAALRAGTWTDRVKEGAGKHTHLNGGNGLANAGNAGTYESGWSDGDVDKVHRDTKRCDEETWTDIPGAKENMPINCVNWYTAAAFCIWDRGFLPSEAEWEYAAAGGSEQREYPWGTAAPGTACPGTGCWYAIYDCRYPDGIRTCPKESASRIGPVGYASQGGGKWGHFDLAGNVWEWNLDWFSGAYVSPSADSAYLSVSGERVHRGNDYAAGEPNLRPPVRSSRRPIDILLSGGVRCARTP